MPAACADHTFLVPRRHNGRSVGITRLWDHTGITGFARNHAPQESRRHNALRSGTTHLRNHARHNERSVGTTPSTRSRCRGRAISTTGVRTTPAPRAFGTTGLRTTPAPRAFGTTGLRTTPAPRAFGTTGLRTTPAQRAFAHRSRHNERLGSGIRRIQNEKERQSRCHGCRTVEFSWPRARCTGSRQNSHDLAREAVGWNDLFGAPATVVRVASRMRRPHPHGTTPARRAFGRNHAPLVPHLAQRAFGWNHAPLESRAA